MNWTFTNVALNDLAWIALTGTVVNNFPAILRQSEPNNMNGGTLYAVGAI